jgi:hypothetical protein
LQPDDPFILRGTVEEDIGHAYRFQLDDGPAVLLSKHSIRYAAPDRDSASTAG